jgi:hypothetical protein
MKLIFRFKGGPGSGAHGHKGIPGHWGGGLPTINKLNITDLMTNTINRDEVLKQLVDALNEQFQMYVKFVSTGGIACIDVEHPIGQIAGLWDPNISTIFFSNSANTGALLQNMDKFGEVYVDADTNLRMPRTRSMCKFGAIPTVIHEFGHAYDDASAHLSSQPEFNEIYESYVDRSFSTVEKKDPHIRVFNEKTADKIISTYSLSSAEECFAEAFSAYVVNKDYLKWAQPKMYDFFEHNTDAGQFNLNNVKVHKEVVNDMVEIALANGTFVWVPKSSVRIS